ncbi:MAG: PfkB family carbohydrate kinase, partial [Planctomycetota bacterium]|nr:PfkB family carbohydrate kinase [Planctomycetota bacterium]
MPLLAVGTVALDTIETPGGKVEDVLGGSVTHFAAVASLFTRVRLVAAIGQDFPSAQLEFLKTRDVDLDGLEVREGRSFRWSGRYAEDMNQRETISVELNVIEGYQPNIPEKYRDSRFVFLGNGSPVTQASVLWGVDNPEFVLVDTMDLWIETEREALVDLLKKVDAITLNDDEIRLLTGQRNLVSAGKALIEMGPKAVFLKKGEHGAIVISQYGIYLLPAFPTEKVVDPTGAGDSFAGGIMGYLASVGE